MIQISPFEKKIPTTGILLSLLGLIACDSSPNSKQEDDSSSSQEVSSSSGISKNTAFLEPTEGILHCAGQSDKDFAEYSAVLGSQMQPAVTMHYFGLKDWWADAKTWSQTVESQISKYPETFLALQIGLSLTKDGDPRKHYESDVYEGLLDKEIDEFLDALESLSRPVYLRIGYEFNGLTWNGYQPDSYKKAFVYLAEKIRERNLEVALVWNAASSGVSSYMDYYPGDEFVDWWGINWFHPEQLGNKLSLDFLKKSKEHKKPVMIGEASPAGVGSRIGQERWDIWFKPFFALIDSNPQIKMSCFINTDWTNYPDFPQWKSWGDGRIQIDSVVSRLYKEKMSDKKFLHGANESLSRTRWYESSGVVPAMVEGLKANSEILGRIDWDKQAEVVGYIIEKDGKPYARTAQNYFVDSQLYEGSSGSYIIRAISLSGLMSDPSQPVVMKQLDSVEKMINGEFTNASDSWAIFNYNSALGSMALQTENDNAYAQITLKKTTGTSWHLQFAQGIQLNNGLNYHVTFKARSKVPTTIEVMLQQQNDPYAVYGMKTVELTTEWSEFTFTNDSSSDEMSRLTFMLGASEPTVIEIDDVSVLESQ